MASFSALIPATGSMLFGLGRTPSPCGWPWHRGRRRSSAVECRLPRVDQHRHLPVSHLIPCSRTPSSHRRHHPIPRRSQPLGQHLSEGPDRERPIRPRAAARGDRQSPAVPCHTTLREKREGAARSKTRSTAGERRQVPVSTAAALPMTGSVREQMPRERRLSPRAVAGARAFQPSRAFHRREDRPNAALSCPGRDLASPCGDPRLAYQLP